MYTALKLYPQERFFFFARQKCIGITVSSLVARFVYQAESGCYGCSRDYVEVAKGLKIVWYNDMLRGNT